jgi:hypothetical protein
MTVILGGEGPPRLPFSRDALKQRDAFVYAPIPEDNRAVIFRFESGHVVEVDYVDYH